MKPHCFFHFKNSVDIHQKDDLIFRMDIIKLHYSKYALAVYIDGKRRFLTADGKLVSFHSKEEAEEIKERIQRNVHLIVVRTSPESKTEGRTVRSCAQDKADLKDAERFTADVEPLHTPSSEEPEYFPAPASIER